jgi:hypothetical protein
VVFTEEWDVVSKEAKETHGYVKTHLTLPPTPPHKPVLLLQIPSGGWGMVFFFKGVLKEGS